MQIPVTSFTDPQEARFASRGVLAGHESQPGGKLAPVFESAYIADACHERTGTQGTNAWDLIQAPDQGALAVPRENLLLPLAHRGAEFPQVAEEMAEALPQSI